jgi:hypothetical protein
MDKKKLKCLHFMTIVILASILSPVDAVHIEPSYLDVKLDGARPSGAFTLSNSSDVEERYRLNALYFEITKTGGIATPETGDRSLASWIRFNPREVTLPPGTSRRVRFTILPRGTLTPGEYWCAMELENLDIQTVIAGDPNADPNTETKATIQVTSALLVPIFGTVGTVNYSGELTAARVVSVEGKPRLDILFQSKSSGRLGIAGNFVIKDDMGQVLYEDTCAQGYVMAGKQRIFDKDIKADIPPGQYTLSITAKASYVKEPLTLTQKIQWPPPELVVPKPTVTVQSASNSTEGSTGTQKGDTTNKAPMGANSAPKEP